MDRRSWPWKKKSSDKATVALEALADSAVASVSAHVPPTQEKCKKPSYVQISVESYTHMSGLEDEVKSYKEQVQTQDIQIIDLNRKLSTAQEDIVTKEALAEEAISGWEKAETEASTLKIHLEAVTLEKLTVEDRAALLDSALKECMRGISILKEEHEQELHDVIFSKTKQFEKLKHDLESKMANLDQELLKSEAENAAIARSLQGRSNMLVMISEQKSQAEAEIEHLRGKTECFEREIATLKYELHLASKELELRNEEKDMSMRSADVANKQHADAVKKITKLEAENQRLRGLVRKKLPSPSALARMKLDGSLGRDYGDSGRRSSGRTSSPQCPFPDFQLEEVHKIQRDNEFLTEQLLAMEEDTKMLKEALAKRNMELQDSRDLCASISRKRQSAEVKTHQADRSILKLSKAVSLTSMSEDGNEYAPSSAESWSIGLNSDHSQCKQGKAESAHHMDLMDDFLEMEKLACSSNDSNALLTDTINDDKLQDVEEKSSNAVVTCSRSDIDVDQLPLTKLQARISMLDDYISKESEGARILEDMRSIVKDSLQHLSSCCGLKKIHCSDASEDAGMTSVKEISPSKDTYSAHTISQETSAPIYQIHDFVVSLGKAAEAVQDVSPDDDGLVEKVKEFSEKFSLTINEKTNVVHFIADLSHVLHKANGLRFMFLGSEENDVGNNGSEYIDKVALPVHEVVMEDIMGDTHKDDCSGSGGDREVHGSSNPEPGVEVKSASSMCILEDFKKIKMEKETLETEFLRCLKELENAQTQLSETEGKLSELKSLLDLSQKSNSIAETQLKCMVESYRSLERRADELETELNLLHEKTKKLENELQEEKTKHQDALDRCDDLQVQLQRNSSKSESSMPDVDHRTSQEKELAAAAEKLAECQETVFLLGRQLKSFRPQLAPEITPEQDIYQRVSNLAAHGEQNITFENMLELDRAKIEAAASVETVYRTGSVSPMTDVYNALYIPSDSEANSYLRSPINVKHQKHRSTHSLPPAHVAQTPEKHPRGISRFFSARGK